MVINGFLIVTLSSGLIAAIPKITQNPSSGKPTPFRSSLARSSKSRRIRKR